SHRAPTCPRCAWRSCAVGRRRDAPWLLPLSTAPPHGGAAWLREAILTCAWPSAAALLCPRQALRYATPAEPEKTHWPPRSSPSVANSPTEEKRSSHGARMATPPHSVIVLERRPQPREARARQAGQDVDGQVVLIGHAVRTPFGGGQRDVRVAGVRTLQVAWRIPDDDEHLTRARARSPQVVAVTPADDRRHQACATEQL